MTVRVGVREHARKNWNGVWICVPSLRDSGRGRSATRHCHAGLSHTVPSALVSGHCEVQGQGEIAQPASPF